MAHSRGIIKTTARRNGGMHGADTELDKLTNSIEAEAEFLASHSHSARVVVDFVKKLDREIKIAIRQYDRFEDRLCGRDYLLDGIRSRRDGGDAGLGHARHFHRQSFHPNARAAGSRPSERRTGSGAGPGQGLRLGPEGSGAGAMEFSVRHFISGRIRLHLPSLCRKRSCRRGRAGLAASAARALKRARLNYACASLVIEYDVKFEGVLRAHARPALGDERRRACKQLVGTANQSAVTVRPAAAIAAGAASRRCGAARRWPCRRSRC